MTLLLQVSCYKTYPHFLYWLSEQHYDQSRIEVDNKVLQLHRLEVERRKAEAVATKEFNQAKVSHYISCSDCWKKVGKLLYFVFVMWAQLFKM